MWPCLEVKKLECSLRLKIKCNDWLLVDTYNLEALTLDSKVISLVFLIYTCSQNEYLPSEMKEEFAFRSKTYFGRY